MAKHLSTTVVVVGLGRFGSSVAQTLMRMGHEVLGIDDREDMVQKWSSQFSQTVQANAGDVTVLRQLGVANFEHAVVAIGSDLEASVLTVLALQELGVKNIWAKAVGHNHGEILRRVGATQVIYPELTMGERVAHLVTGKMMDYIELDDQFAIAKTRAPQRIWNKSLNDAMVRQNHQVTIVAIKRPKEDLQYATAQTVIQPGDILIISGKSQDVERFAALD